VVENKFLLEETAFRVYAATLRKMARLIQKGITVNGNDKVVFSVQMMPYEYFSAFVACLSFDRKSDTVFRFYKHGNYNIEILLSKRADVAFILGDEAIANKEHNPACYSKVLISEQYPVKMVFRNKAQSFQMQLEYSTKEVNQDGSTKNFKPTEERRREEMRVKQRHTREKRKHEFIDSSNLLEATLKIDTPSEIRQSKRRRKKSWRVKEPQYIVRQILFKSFCQEDQIYLYRTLWANGEKTWQLRTDFLDVAKGREDIVCQALQEFEANEIIR